MFQIKKSKGYTLIEIIAAIVIAGIIATVFVTVINGGLDALFFLRGQKSSMAEARSVLKRMVREIKTTNSASTADILNSTATYFQFRDIDDNVIGYQKVGTDLQRNGSVVLQNLASADGLNFDYLDSTGEATATASNMRAIKITLIIEGGENRVRLQSTASIRNR